MVKICECCGHPLPELEIAEYLTRQQTLILIALKKAGRVGLTLSQVVDKLHGHDPDGGPEFAAQSVRVQVSKLRFILKPHGLTIFSAKNATYRLEQVNA